MQRKIPVVIEGVDALRNPVREKTDTLLINDGGALVPLDADFQLHDVLTITNLRNSKKAECQVVWRSAQRIEGLWSFGVSFSEPLEGFWNGEMA